MTHLAEESASRRFSRLFQACTCDIVEPAMKRAAQPPILAPSKCEIGAAMRAMALEQSVASGGITEQHEVFAEETHTFDWARVG